MAAGEVAVRKVVLHPSIAFQQFANDFRVLVSQIKHRMGRLPIEAKPETKATLPAIFGKLRDAVKVALGDGGKDGRTNSMRQQNFQIPLDIGETAAPVRVKTLPIVPFSDSIKRHRYAQLFRSEIIDKAFRQYCRVGDDMKLYARRWTGKLFFRPINQRAPIRPSQRWFSAGELENDFFEPCLSGIADYFFNEHFPKLKVHMRRFLVDVTIRATQVAGIRQLEPNHHLPILFLQEFRRKFTGKFFSEINHFQFSQGKEDFLEAFRVSACPRQDVNKFGNAGFLQATLKNIECVAEEYERTLMATRVKKSTDIPQCCPQSNRPALSPLERCLSLPFSFMFPKIAFLNYCPNPNI